MKTLCYVRQGRRFVPVPDYTGYFYGMDGFKEKETFASYAIVISQDANIATLAYLGHSIERMTWHKANEYCTSIKNAYMPSLIEMLQVAKFKEHLRFKDFDTELTSTSIFRGGIWYLSWRCGYPDIGCSYRTVEHYVRPFFKLDVLTGKRIECHV